MKKTLKIEVPNDWSAITLKDYLAFRKDMETYKDEEEAVTAVMFHHFCKFPLEYFQQLDIDNYIGIKDRLLQFLQNTNLPLKRFVTIDGVEYGFEPNLSQMAYGAYLDISKYESVGIDSKWAEIMSILYRPVTNKLGALYDIKPYDAQIDGQKFMDVTMDVHWGALFFFKRLLADLQKSTLKSLKEELTEIHLPQKLKQILAESGNLTIQ